MGLVERDAVARATGCGAVVDDACWLTADAAPPEERDAERSEPWQLVTIMHVTSARVHQMSR